MKLALHIGTPKTGTTSCQRWFSQNRDVLRGQGIIYSRSLGEYSHRALAVYAQNPNKANRSFAHFGINTPQDHADFRRQLAEKFGQEIAQHDQARHWVISSEHLFSNITKPEMIQQVRDFLQPYFAEITVFLHLRPQVDLLVSGASQRARMGRAVTPQILTRPAVSDQSAYFNYNSITKKWADVFGIENLKIIPFRKQPDMAQTLITHLGACRDGTTAPLRTNEALGWQTMALVNALGDAAASVKPLHKSLFLDQQPKGERLQIGMEMARKIQARFQQSNAMLCQRHPDIAPQDLEPDWHHYDAPANVYNLNEETGFSKQFAYVIARYQQELRLAKAKTLLAETALLLHKGETGGQAKLVQVQALLRMPDILAELHSDQQDMLARKDNLQKQISALESKQP